MGFSRHEYWSGLPFPSPGDLPDPGIEPRSQTLYCLSHQGSHILNYLRASLVAQSVKNPSAMQESACNVIDPGLIPGLGRSPEERNGNTL